MGSYPKNNVWTILFLKPQVSGYFWVSKINVQIVQTFRLDISAAVEISQISQLSVVSGGGKIEGNRLGSDRDGSGSGFVSRLSPANVVGPNPMKGWSI